MGEARRRLGDDRHHRLRAERARRHRLRRAAEGRRSDRAVRATSASSSRSRPSRISSRRSRARSSRSTRRSRTIRPPSIASRTAPAGCSKIVFQIRTRPRASFRRSIRQNRRRIAIAKGGPIIWHVSSRLRSSHSHLPRPCEQRLRTHQRCSCRLNPERVRPGIRRMRFLVSPCIASEWESTGRHPKYLAAWDRFTESGKGSPIFTEIMVSVKQLQNGFSYAEHSRASRIHDRSRRFQIRAERSQRVSRFRTTTYMPITSHPSIQATICPSGFPDPVDETDERYAERA